MTNPTTVSENAQMPRQGERRGGVSVPYTKMYPLIKGGQCDFCGTIDKNQEAIYQYKLCPHFRGIQLECSYCLTKNVAPHPLTFDILRKAFHNLQIIPESSWEFR